MAQLMTSLAEIKSFNPCVSGWKNIIAAHGGINADFDAQFPLVDCLESNSISDVCWLIGKRKTEIQICVKFARMCADSVKHLNNNYAAAAAANAYAAAYAYAADIVDAYAAYAYVADAAAAANAYADAAAANAAANADQKEKNKQFLIQCINQF